MIFRFFALYFHGTIIGTGITCKKIPCYMRDSACRWFTVKKANFLIFAGVKKMQNLDWSMQISFSWIAEKFSFLLLRLLTVIISLSLETKKKNYFHCYCETLLSNQVSRTYKWSKTLCQINQEILKAWKK